MWESCRYIGSLVSSFVATMRVLSANSMFSNKYQIVSFCNYLGCNVDSEIGDGTKQGTCSKGEICFPDWTCKG